MMPLGNRVAGHAAGRKRVCVVSSLPFGAVDLGVGRVVYRQAQGLAERGWEVHVVTPGGKDNPMPFSTSPHIHYHRAGDVSTVHPPLLGPLVSSVVENFDIGLVYAHTFSAIYQLRPRLPRERSCRVVGVCQHSIFGELEALAKHGALLYDGLHLAPIRLSYLWKEIRGISMVDHMVVPSRFTLSELQRIYHVRRENLTIIPDGVDWLGFSARPSPFHLRTKLGMQGSFVLLFIGGIEARKGISTLISAFRLARETCSGLRLIIIGRGPAETKLARLIERFGLQRDVTRIPRVSMEELPTFYEVADLVVIPSLYEGFGLVLLESLASDRPVIASSIPPFKELLNDSNAETMFAPESATKLAELICDRWGARDREPAHSTLAHRRIETFDWSHVSDRLDSFLASWS